ncbi:hypothetical protein [Candidatus Palauibacter sp.]
MSEEKKRKPGRPPKQDYDIMKQQRTIDATPEQVAKAILRSPPDKK